MIPCAMLFNSTGNSIQIILLLVFTRCASDVYEPICNSLKELQQAFLVTLLYMPISWMTEAMPYLKDIFDGHIQLSGCKFSCLYSTQDEEVRTHITAELKKQDPCLRLLLCTSCVGMGFDSLSITNIIFARPPRTIVDYVQQIGRAGRCGQPAEAELFFNNSDIASNVPGMTNAIIELCRTDDCLRMVMLKNFGFYKKASKIKMCECCSNCWPKCNCDICRNDV